MKEPTLKKMPVPFTQVANCILQDKNLSLRAKGVYAYLYSKPEGWKFSASRIASESSDGRKPILKALRELEKGKYLNRVKHNDGSIDYFVVFKPKSHFRTLVDKSAKSQNGTVPKRHSAKTGLISNTINTSNTNNTSDEGSSHTMIVALIDLFKDINPAFADWYKNKTQRDACLWLIETYGFEEARIKISYLPRLNSMPYSPTTTTPYELKVNMAKIEAFARKSREKSFSKGRGIA